MKIDMKINNPMSSALSRYKITEDLQKIRLALKLQNLLNEGICKLEECFFLTKLLPNDFHIDQALKLSFDRTQLECDCNHIHIEDYLNSRGKNQKYLIEQGLAFGLKIHQLLGESHHFMIIISFSQDEFLDCNVRFHRKRENENWLANDINLYEEGIAVFE